MGAGEHRFPVPEIAAQVEQMLGDVRGCCELMALHGGTITAVAARHLALKDVRDAGATDDLAARDAALMSAVFFYAVQCACVIAEGELEVQR